MGPDSAGSLFYGSRESVRMSEPRHWRAGPDQLCSWHGRQPVTFRLAIASLASGGSR